MGSRNTTGMRIAQAIFAGMYIALATAVPNVGAGEPCEPHWNNTIGKPGVAGTIRALAVDEGSAESEPALYAAGGFQTAGGVTAFNIAKWDGQSWSSLGSGTNLEILSMAVFDDGTPKGDPVLFAGGQFTIAGGVEANGIAKWDGEEWSALGSGMNGSVDAMTSFDHGTGLVLYAGGHFTTAGGIEANNVAKWDSASGEWSALGSGVSGEPFLHEVLALTVFDDGTRGTPGNGPALYAGGHFTIAGVVEANHIAKWDGASREWSALGSGMNGAVHALAVFDDGTPGGPALYAGGNFTIAGGATVNFIAKWNADSGEWSALGGGLNNAVRGLAVFDDGSPGSGPALYAGGAFTTAGGVSANFIAKWDAATEEWSALGSGVDGTVRTLAVFDDSASGIPGSGPALYAGGTFTTAGGQSAGRIARWSAPQPSAPGDLNCDGVVDGADLAILLGAWGACPPAEPGGDGDCGACPADLNNDCTVDGADLAILLGNWG